MHEVVVLPPSEIKWVITQPESTLSAQEMHRDQLQSDWTFLNQNIVKHPIHQDAIRNNMVRKLDSFTEPVMDELRQCFEDYWGMSTEWHEVNIWDSMMKFFARTSNRMFVGLPLCRNEAFLDGCRGFAQDVMVSTAILTLMPAWLKPILGYAAIAPNYWHYRKAGKYLIPLIQSRLETLKKNPEKGPVDLLPNDLVTWSIIEAQKSPDPREMTLELLAKRTMTVNMAAIHTSTMTSTNLLIDLLSSDPKRGYVKALTSEIETISSTHQGDWSKSTLAAMTRTDSALRESMRVSGFVVWGVERKVVAKDGVVLPDGTKVPNGANIAVAAWDNHHDDRVYPQPFEYDALRFSRQREQLGSQQVHVGEEGLVEGEEGYEGGASSEKNLSKVLEGKNLSTVTTGSHFMQFGTLSHPPEADQCNANFKDQGMASFRVQAVSSPSRRSNC